MGRSYETAIQNLAAEAQSQGAAFSSRAERCSPFRASGRIALHAIRSPETTPKFDTSAMDGYALNSEATINATEESPAVFLVRGTMAAGDEPISVSGEPVSGVYPCVEIMTGARFPGPFDCCVRVEDTTSCSEESSSRRYVKLTKPARPQQNRRLAGGDFKEGDVIVPAGAVITAAHIMAMASVGITEIEVMRKIKIAIFSTGSELLPPDTENRNAHRIRDANAPYLVAVLRDWGVDADFLEVLEDDADSMVQQLQQHINRYEYDVIISTGAVSTGRFDTIPTSLERLNARVIFHQIAIRPGHPALFGAVSGSRLGEIAYFGLPGNPVATAACLRFLVNPYLRFLQGQQAEIPLKASVRPADNGKADSSAASLEDAQLISRFPPDTDVFRPGIFDRLSDGSLEVRLIRDHSPGKVKPFAASNCWIHIHRDTTELREGDVVDIFPN